MPNVWGRTGFQPVLLFAPANDQDGRFTNPSPCAADSSTGVGEYQIERRNAQEPALPPTILAGYDELEPYTDTTFEDTTAEPGVIYRYVVRTWNAEYTIAESDFAFGWAGDAAAPPETPSVTDLAATQGTLTNKIRLTWNSSNTRWVESYVITRGEWDGDVPFSSRITIPCTGDNYFDDEVDPGKRYEYEIEVSDIWGRSSVTDIAVGWAAAAPVPAIVNFSATQGTLADKVRLSWSVTDPESVASYSVIRFLEEGEVMGYETLADSLTSTGGQGQLQRHPRQWLGRRLAGERQRGP